MRWRLKGDIMKIVFLDIDGVLNTDNMLFERHRLLFKGKRKIPFEKGPLKNFCGLVKWMMDNEAYFVISSSWRISSVPRDWNKIFRHFGVKKNLVVSVTSYGMFRRRGEEILHWIHRHKESFSVERYAVIDDEDFDIRGFVPEKCFFHIDSGTGITRKNVEGIIDFLSKI